MKRLAACLGLAIAIAALATGRAAHAAGEPVEIANGGVTLKAVLFRPSGSGPFPAVVALHACDGLGDAATPIEPRYVEWGERLAAAGYVTLFPDSFASRGLGAQCKVRDRPVRASQLRTRDANAARDWLQSQPFVNRTRVSLLGWDHGGTTLLWTIRRGPRIDTSAPEFRSAVALYPNCSRSGASAWSARVPTLILIGSADDWTLATQCQQMMTAARGRSAAVSVVVYPRAAHSFDVARLAFHERTGIATTANASGRVHAGTNEAARVDAFKRVTEWLAR